MNDSTMARAKSPQANCNTPDSFALKGDRKKKSIIPKIFSSKQSGSGGGSSDDNVSESEDIEKKNTTRRKDFMEAAPLMGRSFSERQQTSSAIEGLNLSNFEQSITTPTETKQFQIFVTTWNVGGRTPSSGLNLEDFLQVESAADIYVCGFQEIVPLSASNVLVIEDNEPAAKWLKLMNQALNNQLHECCSASDPRQGPRAFDISKDAKSNFFFHKPSLKVLSRSFRADGRLLKLCNCHMHFPTQEKQGIRKISDSLHDKDSESLCRRGYNSAGALLDLPSVATTPCSTSRHTKYSLIASKQMVGIFVSVWAKADLVPHIGHLRISSLGRGIMGCLGNKGCISISMSLHRTSICFVCCHLASGEKEGDELKRNADVAEIVKSIQFRRICKNQNNIAPERIMDHDRVLWFGDLNYRIALSYDETRVLLENNDWDALLGRDQLNIERGAGRVFDGFGEGRIMFAPTYKYSQNSDSYAGETAKSKKKRRTPAWCDRILWHGKGIEQLYYTRSESRFSDHRPVCAGFTVDVEVMDKGRNRFRKGYSCAIARLEFDEGIPQRHSFYGC